MAGRNITKLQGLQGRLAAEVPSISQAATVVADVNDKSQINELAKNTKVLINVAGPYTKYGDPVVEACIENGTHYCDLTGENTSCLRL